MARENRLYNSKPCPNCRIRLLCNPPSSFSKFDRIKGQEENADDPRCITLLDRLLPEQAVTLSRTLNVISDNLEQRWPR